MPAFQEVCTVEVDLKSMMRSLEEKKKPSRSCFSKPESYWVLPYSIAFHFGATELKAFVVWKDRVPQFPHFMHLADAENGSSFIGKNTQRSSFNHPYQSCGALDLRLCSR